MPACGVSAYQTHIENLGRVEFLLPERFLLDELVVHIGRVVDQHIEPAFVLGDAFKKRGHLFVVTVIAVDWHPFAAIGGDLLEE